MAKITYPPIIEGVLPAFYSAKIQVPFTMNRGVGKNEVTSFQIRVSNLSTGLTLFTMESTSIDWTNKIVVFEDPEPDDSKNLFRSNLDAPNFYKVQIAYKNKSGIGPYSTIGIAKYTNRPTVSLSVNNKATILTGTYETKDQSEKLYTSYFIVKNSQGEIVVQTEPKIHNGANDTINSENKLVATETYTITKSLNPGEKYLGFFYIETIGGIKKNYSDKEIKRPANFDIPTYFILEPQVDYENGGIDLTLVSGVSKISGTYKLARTDNRSNFEEYVDLLTFSFSNTKFPIYLWKDLTVEQGVEYQYAVFKYSKDNGFASEKRASLKIVADFESMFLFDGKRQLKLKFNPKVTSFKSNILEAKQDTLGSQYPFIFRNGYVNYKEFPISGLISYLQDEQDLFVNKDGFLRDSEKMELINSSHSTDEAYGTSMYATTSLSGENFYNERQFKMEVYNWLTNGEPKIFRSPAEGNFLIRLMNTSLSPLSDGISRLVHTFSSTAYEIGEFTIENLIKNNFIKSSVKPQSPAALIKNISLTELNSGSNIISKINGTIYEVEFYIPSGRNIPVKINGKEVYVYTGYKIDSSVTSIQKSSTITTGYLVGDMVSIKYYSDDIEDEPFDVVSINTFDLPCFQAFGRSNVSNLTTSTANSEHNLLQDLYTINKKIITVYSFKVTKMPFISAYLINNSYYYSTEEKASQKITINPGFVYQIYEKSGTTWKSSGFKYKTNITDSDWTTVNSNCLTAGTVVYKTKSSSKKITLSDNKPVIIKNVLPKEIYATPGVVIEICGRYSFNDYKIYESRTEISGLREAIDVAIDNFSRVNNLTDENGSITIKGNAVDKITGQYVNKNGGSVPTTNKSVLREYSDKITIAFTELKDRLNELKG